MGAFSIGMIMFMLWAILGGNVLGILLPTKADVDKFFNEIDWSHLTFREADILIVCGGFLLFYYLCRKIEEKIEDGGN